ncbi:unnamed protein product [Darwinula stevensoni]|uniref:CARD domain-containing protein n=1 Tax=Darwinula stevensoni TaxID=69355 RepID=A0A7R9ACM6_9CRUS|nr:unnamed protein product [Darwinula stevensoni]CAG0900525.1 unnamed protein product [Darwinula stevensoni]
MATPGAAVSAVMAEHLNTYQQYTDLEEILRCLLIKKVIQLDEYHEQMDETREKRKKQALFLLRKIPTAGDGAFLAFLECLKEKHRNLAETLLTSLGQKNEAYAREVRAQWQGGSSTATQGGSSTVSQATRGQPGGSSLTWDRIRANRRRLRDHFNLDFRELLRSLSDRSVFLPIEEQQIRGITTPILQFDEFFDLLLRKNPQQYVPIFLEALVEIGREDIRDALQGILITY